MMKDLMSLASGEKGISRLPTINISKNEFRNTHYGENLPYNADPDADTSIVKIEFKLSSLSGWNIVTFRLQPYHIPIRKPYKEFFNF